MTTTEYCNIPSPLMYKWESTLAEIINQMGLKKVLLVSDIETNVGGLLSRSEVSTIGTGYKKMPYKDDTFDAVCLLFATRVDDNFDSRILELKRICKDHRYVFVLETYKGKKGLAKWVSEKFIHEKVSTEKTRELTDAIKTKEHMLAAGFKHVNIKYLFPNCCNIITASK